MQERDELVKLSRRDAVKRVGAWVIYAGGLAALPACTPQPGSGETTPPVCGGPVSGIDTGLSIGDVAENAVAYHSASSLLVCHDATGFYAMTSICTHAGCDMGNDGGGQPVVPTNLSDGFLCACHGSRFDANGAVTQGPATLPLRHYKLTVDGSSKIFVDDGIHVDASTRCTA